MKMMWEDVSYYIWQATMFQKINNDIISYTVDITTIWKVSCKILSNCYQCITCFDFLISHHIQQNIYFIGQTNLWTLFVIRTLADWSLSYFQSHICKTIFEYAWEISTIWRQITLLDFVFGSKFLALHLRNRPTKKLSRTAKL